MKSLYKYTRVLQRIKNRTNAIRDELQSDSTKKQRTSKPSRFYNELESMEEKTPSKPVNLDDVVYLDSRDERAVKRDLYSTAARMFAKNQNTVIVKLREDNEV